MQTKDQQHTCSQKTRTKKISICKHPQEGLTISPSLSLSLDFWGSEHEQTFPAGTFVQNIVFPKEHSQPLVSLNLFTEVYLLYLNSIFQKGLQSYGNTHTHTHASVDPDWVGQRWRSHSANCHHSERSNRNSNTAEISHNNKSRGTEVQRVHGCMHLCMCVRQQILRGSFVLFCFETGQKLKFDAHVKQLNSHQVLQTLASRSQSSVCPKIQEFSCLSRVELTPLYLFIILFFLHFFLSRLESVPGETVSQTSECHSFQRGSRPSTAQQKVTHLAC